MIGKEWMVDRHIGDLARSFKAVTCHQVRCDVAQFVTDFMLLTWFQQHQA